jgi:hypothetical protein
MHLDYVPQPTDLITCPVCGNTYARKDTTAIPGLGSVDNACIEAEVRALTNTAREKAPVGNAPVKVLIGTAAA